MSVLIFRLEGPQQSWGTRSRFEKRDTHLEPSKSGVLGLLCAALGRPRGQNLEDLAGLKMGVRVDREGRLLRDYHTAQQVRRAEKGIQNTVLSERFYLADASFLVGLEGEVPLLMQIKTALVNPVWALSLGRKSFVPSVPIWGKGPFEGSLQEVLISQPLVQRRGEKPPETLRAVMECPDGKGEPRADQPVSFALGNREFVVRHVKTEFWPLPEKETPCF